MACAFPIAIVVRFSQPWWLLALTAGAVPVLLAAGARARGRSVGRFSVALQCLALLAAAAALGGPEAMLGGAANAPWIVLRDVSGSVRGQDDAEENWQTDRPRELFRVADVILAEGAAPGAHRTVAGPALRLAAGRARQAAGIVIRTDGRFHDADWPGAAATLGRTGVEVFIVPIDSPPADARVAELRADRDAGGQCRLRVRVFADTDQRRTLTVTRGGRQLWRRTLDLLAGETAVLHLSDAAAPADRAAVYVATISPPDQFAENDSAAALLPPPGRTLAIVAGEGAGLPAGLAGAIGTPAQVIAASDAPTTAAGWMSYAAVLVVDSTGALLGADQRRALAEYVRSGGGLVLVGAGPHARPADRDDPLNRVAALVANPHERTPLKVIVALDASGSMGEPSIDAAAGARRKKFDAAAGAVMALKHHLTEADALAVITFSDKAKLIYDSNSRRADFVRLRDALAAVEPAGSTDAGAGLAEAARQRVPDRLRGLFLLVSDLLSKRVDHREIAGALRSARLSLAIVEIRSPGDAAEGTADLKELAKALGAPHVRLKGLSGLAKVFARFVRGGRGEAIRRGKFQVTVSRNLLNIDAAKAEGLDAYVLSVRRGDAEVIAAVGSDAILARRTVGLGRTVSIAVPLEAPHNPRWSNSAGWRSVLAAAVRWVLTPQDDPRFDGELTTQSGSVLLTINARDPNGPMNFLKLFVTSATRAVSPGSDKDPGAAAAVGLVQTAPGRYEGQLALPRGRPVSVAVGDAGGRTVWRGSYGTGVADEFAALGADWEALRRLAALTGGRIVAPRDLPAAARAVHDREYSPLWQLLLAAAVAIMLLEWALTRVWQTET